MKLKFTFTIALALLAASLAVAQTTDPKLPDVALFNYSGDQSITQYIGTSDFYTTVHMLQTAQCLGQGYQGNPASTYGTQIYASMTYHLNPPPLPSSCGPIQVEIDGIMDSYNPQTGLPDHLEQVMAVYAVGSLPSPPAPFPGFPGIRDQLSACSLLGDPPYLELGAPRTWMARTGLCWFYAAGLGVTNCTVCTF